MYAWNFHVDVKLLTVVITFQKFDKLADLFLFLSYLDAITKAQITDSR